MIGQRFKYTMLMSGLPRHPRSLFAAKQTPLSRIQLERRLALLDTQDHQDLTLLEDILFWSRLSAATDARVVEKCDRAMNAIKNDFAKQMALLRLEIRSLMTALRKRNKGEPPPHKNEIWGISRWLPFINKNWQQDDFGMGHLVRWLPEANKLLAGHESLELEKLLLGITWLTYSREANKHAFDFEAVVIYVLRWDIINRWTRYDGEQALIRFDKLVADGMRDVSPIV